MKAYSLHAVGQIMYEDVPIPTCRPNWCIVKVMAAGICSSDIPRIFTKGTYHFPTIPGHEFSGVVDRVGDQKDMSLIGKRVGVFPLIPCRTCQSCIEHRYETCENYDYLGSRRDGGFAEYVAVPTWNLIEIADQVSFIDAAIMEPLAVSLHAVKKLNIKASDNVAIVGTGMIAFAAAQWAVKFGAASVTVLGRNEGKSTIAHTIGNIDYAVYGDGSKQYDAVIEAVGSNDAIESAINSTSSGGRIVLMGNPAGNITLRQDTYWRILRKQLVVKGTWNSSYEKDLQCDWSEVAEALAKKSINVSSLVSHVFSQQELEKGLHMMREHTEQYCKVMTIWNGE